MSQTPLLHTRTAAAAVQIPLSVGLVWEASVGTATPLASCAVHVCALSLHQWPVAQSASTLQLPAASHVPVALQAPERHTEAPASELHGPSPLAKPQSLSCVSHTALAQAAAAAATVHRPPSGGACPTTVGTIWPLGTFETHVNEGVLQYWLLEQSASTAQPPAGIQTLLLALHAPDWQTTLPVATEQGPSPLA